jgi:ATP-binding cassette, subfamily B, bacterial
MSHDHGNLKANLRLFASQFRYLPRTIRLIRAAAGSYTIYWCILLVLQGLLPIVTVYLLRSLVNALTAAVLQEPSSSSVRPILFLLGLMIVVQLLSEALRVTASYVRVRQSELVQDYITGLIHDRSMHLDLGFYESPDFYDHLHRAREDANNRPIILLESAGGILQSSITLVAMAIVLMRFGIWMPLALLFSAVPALLIVARYTARYHQWSMRTTPERRRATYYGFVLTSHNEAAEIRLFRLGEYFQERFQDLRKRLRTERLKLIKDQSKAEVSAVTLGYLISAASLAWILWKAFLRQISLGEVALFYQAFYQGQRLMRSVLENLTTLYANSLFLGNLFEFLDLKPQIVSPAQPVSIGRALKNEIRFADVTFHYPGTSRKALDNFSLVVPAGKIAAIVGPNGAGKSTVMKLLCRFYDPDAGHIQLDGVDLRGLELEELRQLITAQFQVSVHYSATAAENIYYGELTQPREHSAIQSAARAAQADETIEQLPNGYETQLVTWFYGGEELSGGEWRRISLARALYRTAPIILLDEPTSAMDSWAETNWMTRFRKVAEGKTVILITHRFPTAMHADMIHVMGQGKIVESGDHESLLAQGGLYAESWRNQTQRLDFNVVR